MGMTNMTATEVLAKQREWQYVADHQNTLVNEHLQHMMEYCMLWEMTLWVEGGNDGLPTFMPTLRQVVDMSTNIT